MLTNVLHLQKRQKAVIQNQNTTSNSVCADLISQIYHNQMNFQRCTQ